MNNEILFKTTLSLAENYYETAQEQYCKPEEDLVPYMVCRSAFKSVGNYLAAFMIHNGMEVNDGMSLEFLLNSCRSLHADFNQLDLSPLYYGNAHQGEVVIADDGTMHRYMDLSTKTRDLVIRAMARN